MIETEPENTLQILCLMCFCCCSLFVFFQSVLREMGVDLRAKISPKCIVILKA